MNPYAQFHPFMHRYVRVGETTGTTQGGGYTPDPGPQFPGGAIDPVYGPGGPVYGVWNPNFGVLGPAQQGMHPIVPPQGQGPPQFFPSPGNLPAYPNPNAPGGGVGPEAGGGEVPTEEPATIPTPVWLALLGAAVYVGFRIVRGM